METSKVKREFFSKLAGVTHFQEGNDPQKLLKKCKPGQELLLVRDPKNKYDSNAIKVYLKTGEQVGWIGRDLAERLSEQIDSGTNIIVTISEITGGGLFSGQSYGCNIKIQIL